MEKDGRGGLGVCRTHTHIAHYIQELNQGMENRWVVQKTTTIYIDVLLFGYLRHLEKKSQIFGALVLNLRDSLEQSSNESYTTLLKNMARYPLGELEALATTTR